MFYMEIEYMNFSPLFPLKGRIAANIGETMLVMNTPLRGQGVMNDTIN